MGFFNVDENQFTVALEALREEGWIHYHSTAARDKMNQPRKFIAKMEKKTRYNLEIKEIRRVKKLSPKLLHLCTDIYVTK